MQYIIQYRYLVSGSDWVPKAPSAIIKLKLPQSIKFTVYMYKCNIWYAKSTIYSLRKFIT